MNDGRSDRRGRPWLRQAGAAAVAGLALLVAACGGGGSAATPTGGSPSLSAITTQALAYAKCMRSHGIVNFPDPAESSQNISFNLTGTRIDQNSAQFKAANKACQTFPPGGP
jgi:hypothetical protein